MSVGSLNIITDGLVLTSQEILHNYNKLKWRFL